MIIDEAWLGKGEGLWFKGFDKMVKHDISRVNKRFFFLWEDCNFHSKNQLKCTSWKRACSKKQGVSSIQVK